MEAVWLTRPWQRAPRFRLPLASSRPGGRAIAFRRPILNALSIAALVLPPVVTGWLLLISSVSAARLARCCMTGSVRLVFTPPVPVGPVP